MKGGKTNRPGTRPAGKKLVNHAVANVTLGLAIVAQGYAIRKNVEKHV